MFNIFSKNLQKLGYEFHIDQKHEANICQYLHFRARKSLSLINIPIPTPASDKGGPVACIGGPVAKIWLKFVNVYYFRLNHITLG